jgi:MerR family transcriptional regulator, heat shock protein HspR
LASNQAVSQRVKIGAVAQRFQISPDLLRLYEREGLLIPVKSLRGTRYFTEQDYRWIATLQRLVRDAHMTFAAIRHLLAMTPCWQVRRCGFANRQDCPHDAAPTRPCWMSRACCKARASDCYTCPVYRSAPESEPLQALLLPEPQG